MGTRANDFGLAITRINKEAQRWYAPVLATWGLAPGMQSYLLVLDPQGKTPQKVLANALGVDPANVSRALRSLVDLGLILKENLPGSQRDFTVELTPRGFEARTKIEDSAKELVQGFASRLDSKDWELLVNLLHKVSCPGNSDLH